MFDQDSEETFQRPEQCAVNHIRLVALSVLADVVDLETFRQIEVELDRGGLPFASDRILYLEVDLRSVECAAAFVHFIGEAAFFNRVDQRFLRLFPACGIADRLFRTGREIRLDLLELESFPDVETETEHFFDFGFDLFRSADDMGVVLRESADAHQTVQHTALFITVNGAEFRPAAGQFAVGTDA